MNKKAFTAKRIITIILSAALMAANVKTFVKTAELFPGGVMGLTLLIQGVFSKFFGIEVPYTIINVLLNLIPVYIGFKFIGKKFTLYSCLSIILIAVFTDIFPGYIVTEDPLLISIFGGILNGLGISMALNVNATTGGTDFISIFLSEKKGFDSFNIILGMNVVILILAGILFGFDKALYSMIYQYASTQVIHILYTKYQKQTLLIITEKPAEICEMIHDVAHHGATILKGEGPYAHVDRKVVYSIISRAQMKNVSTKIHEIDADAYINCIKTDEFTGRFHKDPYD